MTTSWTPVGSNSATWNAVPKPSPVTSVITQVFTGGDPIGLLLALTYSTAQITSIVTSIWTPISDNSTSWTDVPKAS
jgi:hypothetical protein